MVVSWLLVVVEGDSQSELLFEELWFLLLFSQWDPSIKTKSLWRPSEFTEWICMTWFSSSEYTAYGSWQRGQGVGPELLSSEASGSSSSLDEDRRWSFWPSGPSAKGNEKSGSSSKSSNTILLCDYANESSWPRKTTSASLSCHRSSIVAAASKSKRSITMKGKTLLFSSCLMASIGLDIWPLLYHGLLSVSVRLKCLESMFLQTISNMYLTMSKWLWISYFSDMTN